MFQNYHRPICYLWQSVRILLNLVRCGSTTLVSNDGKMHRDTVDNSGDLCRTFPYGVEWWMPCIPHSTLLTLKLTHCLSFRPAINTSIQLCPREWCPRTVMTICRTGKDASNLAAAEQTTFPGNWM